MNRLSIPSSPGITSIEVLYPRHRGRIGLRGSHAPLSWEHTEAPARVEGDSHRFALEVPPDEIVELKVVRNEEDWADGPNYAIHAGDHLLIEPHFDVTQGTVQKHVDGAPLTVDVFLPASYEEQEKKRYPVLYALDGQSLWTTSEDPYGIWHLDVTLDELSDLGAMQEILVVGIHSAQGRLDMLSPVPDGAHGGGGGGAHLLAQIIGPLRTWVNERYRTLPDREHTGIMGASLGGLFAFYAAWSRGDVFGKAACLSSSFWWADRWAVRWMSKHPAPPESRPILYLDSGATMNPAESDVNARDGFHHTRSMLRGLLKQGWTTGVDVHRLVFPGETHDAQSWARRVAIPLQLLFPVR